LAYIALGTTFMYLNWTKILLAVLQFLSGFTSFSYKIFFSSVACEEVPSWQFKKKKKFCFIPIYENRHQITNTIGLSHSSVTKLTTDGQFQSQTSPCEVQFMGEPAVMGQVYHQVLWFCRKYHSNEACSAAVDWGTSLQAGKSRVRFLVVSMEFCIDIILPAALWPRIDSACNRNEYQEYFKEVQLAGAYN